MGNTVDMSFEGKLANGQNVGFTIIFKHVYWYIKQISGERLQDNWSSSIAKLGYVGGIPIFLIFATKHRLWELACTHNLCFEQKIRKITILFS